MIKKSNRVILLSFLFFYLFINSVYSIDFKTTTSDMSAVLYGLNEPTKIPEFYWKLKMDNVLKEPQRTLYFDEQKKLHTEENLEYKNGRLRKYSYSRHNINEHASVEITDSALIFVRTFEGETKTSKKVILKNTIFGPSIVTFIRDNTNTLKKGHTIEINYGALNRLNTYTFNLKEVQRHPLKTKDTIVIQMKAKYFIVQQFVDPLYFVLNKNGTKLKRIQGRALPASNIGGEIGIVDADFAINQY
jgi:hypothetical protein